MLLSKLGLIGWAPIEPIIVSALIAKKPILMIGHPGASKTEAPDVLSRAIQGSRTVFRKYDVPALNHEDLLGVFNPAELSQGKISFIHTPLSVWGATSILLDEINCANHLTQSKLHELVRAQEIMGLPTNVELIFAAINPPLKFQTNFMTLQLASRFVEVDVPRAKDMTDPDLVSIMGSRPKKKPPYYGKKVKAARTLLLDADEIRVAQSVTLAAFRNLSKHPDILSLEGRSVKMIYQLIMAFMQAKKTFSTMAHNDQTVSDLVISCIPELNNAVRKSGNIRGDDIRHELAEVLGPLMVSGETLALQTLEDILNSEIVDELNWLNASQQIILNTKDDRALHKFQKSLKKSKLPTHLQGTLNKIVRQQEMMSQYSSGKILNIASLR